MSGSVMTYEQFINFLISKIEIQKPRCGVRLRSSKEKNSDKKDLLIVHTTIRDISLYPQSLYDDYRGFIQSYLQNDFFYFTYFKAAFGLPFFLIKTSQKYKNMTY